MIRDFLQEEERADSDAFEIGKRKLLKIRDHVLTREAQEMSAPFWN